MTTTIEYPSIEGIRYLQPVTSDAQNHNYTEALFNLVHQGDLSAEQQAYAKVLTILIQDYESRRYPVHRTTPRKVLAELIEVNGLRYRDLEHQLGTESMVSMILKGTRPLNTRHIAKLSKRFKVSPALFIDAR